MSQPILRAFGGKRPEIGAGCFIAETAAVIGDVVIGAESSIWYGTVIRGDVMPIRIGARRRSRTARSSTSPMVDRARSSATIAPSGTPRSSTRAPSRISV